VIRKPLIPDEISAPAYFIVIIFIVLGAESWSLNDSSRGLSKADFGAD
jgi:hypothetical protein